MGALDLEAIKARAGAATPGPWATGQRGEIYREGDRVTDPTLPDITVVPAMVLVRPDMEFIAAAREDVPALVAEVERLSRESAELRAVILWLIDDRGTPAPADISATLLEVVDHG